MTPELTAGDHNADVGTAAAFAEQPAVLFAALAGSPNAAPVVESS